MVTIRLSAILGERRLKMAEVARATGLTVRTVWRYYHSRPKSIDLEVLDRLCAFLGVEPGDLLVRTTDNNAAGHNGAHAGG